MRKGIHPENYQPVIFHDINEEFKVLTRSTIKLGSKKETMKWEDGNTYPVVRVQISSASHTFYVGKKVILDEMGTIAKFKAKYSKKKQNKA